MWYALEGREPSDGHWRIDQSALFPRLGDRGLHPFSVYRNRKHPEQILVESDLVDDITPWFNQGATVSTIYEHFQEELLNYAEKIFNQHNRTKVHSAKESNDLKDQVGELKKALTDLNDHSFFVREDQQRRLKTFIAKIDGLLSYLNEKIQTFTHMPKTQTLSEWYRENKWSFWITVVSIPLILTLLAWILQKGDNKQATLIDTVNGGVVNAQSNIGKQEIYYADRTDPNYENQRSEDLVGLEGKALIQKWFTLMAEQNWRGACSLMSKNDCDAGNWESINTAFHFMKERTQSGYEDPQIQHADNAPPNVWCVRYHYTMAQAGVARKIVEIMQYKLNRREDGSEEITTKLCEKQWMEGKGETKCVNPSVFYCRDLSW